MSVFRLTACRIAGSRAGRLYFSSTADMAMHRRWSYALKLQYLADFPAADWALLRL